MPNSRRRRIGRAIGIVLVVAGLVVLSAAGWQLWGTNWVSHRTQHKLTQDLQGAWANGDATVRTGKGTVSALVKIPRFGKKYAVPLLEGDNSTVLAAGFGHVPNTDPPGGRGNFVLAGHRITHGEPLRNMPSLRAGDTVIVETRDTVFTYRLDTDGNALSVPFTASWVLQPKPVNPQSGGVGPSDAKRLLTLTTCAELFHTDQRLVAFGHLVSKRPR